MQVTIMFDVAVLGAGPGGLATAICCAEAGLSVRVLDRSNFPRPSIGEAVHPGAEGLFERLGVADRIRRAKFVRHSGIWVERRDKREFLPFGETAGKPWRGYQLWRPKFDQILLDRAKELGCEFHAPCVLLDANLTGRAVRVLSTVGDFACKIVVDGTGRNRWLTRHWGLGIRTFSSTLVARYQYAEGHSSDLDENPIFVPKGDGWEWIARVQKNLYQWIGLRYIEDRGRFDTSSHEFQRLRKTGRVSGADVTWSLVERSASLRHFLVGDSAAVLDPSSSHGILRALSSGILAANCIVKILRDGTGERKSAVAGYKAWQRKWFLRDVQNLRTFRQTTFDSVFSRKLETNLFDFDR
jgi:flavin-dependent dehydrogenase